MAAVKGKGLGPPCNSDESEAPPSDAREYLLSLALAKIRSGPESDDEHECASDSHRCTLSVESTAYLCA